MRMHLRDATYAVVDVETTGFDRERDRVKDALKRSFFLCRVATHEWDASACSSLALTAGGGMVVMEVRA